MARGQAREGTAGGREASSLAPGAGGPAGAPGVQAVLGRSFCSVAGEALYWAEARQWLVGEGRWPSGEDHTVFETARSGPLTSTPPGGARRAAEAFRRQRGLLTSDELASWLAWWVLTAGQWTAWLESTVGTASTGFDPLGAGLAASGPGWAEAVCSGLLESAARELALAAAAWAGLNGPPLPSGTGRHSKLRAARSQLMAVRPEVPQLEALVAGRRPEWSVVEADWAGFDGPDAAREALLCVNNDGMDLSAVAELGSSVCRRAVEVVEDIAPALRPAVLSAPVGMAVAAGAPGDARAVVVVRDRVPPSLGIPAVRSRAEDYWRQALVRSSVDRWVRWHEWPGRALSEGTTGAC